MAIYMATDPMTRLTMEMIAHTLGAIQIQQLKTEFQVRDSVVRILIGIGINAE